MTDDPFLRAAIEEARIGRDDGGIPIGSVMSGATWRRPPTGWNGSPNGGRGTAN
jgi:hypothetical protein